MRSFRSLLARFTRLTAVWVVLVILLAACAGGDDKSPDEAANTTDSSSEQQSPAPASAETPQVQGAAQAEDPVAARVNGQPITLAEFQRERDRRAIGQDVQPATQAAFDDLVLQTMIDQLLMEQAAAREGLVVSDAEIDAELAAQSEIAAANGQTFADVIAAQMYTMDEYRAVTRGMLLAQKLSQVVANVSPYSAQVHARHILVSDEGSARQLLTRIQQGEDFAQLAVQYSLDTSTAAAGGDLDWVSEGVLLQVEVEAAIFALQPGQVSAEPVRSSLGYHVIQVLERVEDRPLSAAALAEKKQQAFVSWLDNQRQTAVIERFVGTAG
ncbi:MAG: peptidylprolyl isomerase [Chloroflexi bacterium]|nr:peptidylprolyl isomerase [Chloroflexota bacterium]